MTIPVTAARLRGIELFAELDAERLGWLAGAGEHRVLRDGEKLFDDGEQAEHFYVLLAGELVLSKRIGEREQIVGRHFGDPAAAPHAADKPRAAHQYTGELPLLAGGGYVAAATAAGEVELLAYDKDTFLWMLVRCPEVCRVLLPVLVWRIRSYEAQAGRRTMLEGLGTLAAGLAHELNNPVAALVRAAAEFDRTAAGLAGTAITWGAKATPGERAALDRLVAAPARPELGALAAAEALDAVADWLDSAGLPDAVDLAADLTVADLDALAAEVRPEVLAVAVRLLAGRLSARALAADAQAAGRAISTLVASAAAYADLGRAPEREVDVVAGLEATLRVLAPGLTGIAVVRDFAPLPPVPAHLGELNQVWTHLVRNAAQAMNGEGELRLTTRAEGPCVVVEVRDNGPGVPPELLPRLFQPFFTTKDIGHGTGLGLHLCHEIVAVRHNGSIEAVSMPGDTRFVVRLPAR
ncbi:ATP-binding protein [Amycolatopsis sp. OK19-0408]|uniref:histidine kinase n=1 Tax=Amycolatopsis iheyensis TaxID=2945988 RepID=A0A9X2NJ43_9PSEU|nr:ATP-binding protein [Amycolatopsis iheyensis]MCR6487412.1 ATP-binding protein [Amycolatopsis iheyensis]